MARMIVFVLALCTTAFLANCTAAISVSGGKSPFPGLEGIDEVTVRGPDTGDLYEALRSEQISAILHTAGVRVVPESEASSTTPYLMLNLVGTGHLNPDGKDSAATVTELRLMQSVSLIRDPAIVVSAPTWSRMIARVGELQPAETQTAVQTLLSMFAFDMQDQALGVFE